MISHKAFYIPNAVWHRCCIVWRAGLFALPKSLLTRLLWNSFRIVGKNRRKLYLRSYIHLHPPGTNVGRKLNSNSKHHQCNGNPSEMLFICQLPWSPVSLTIVWNRCADINPESHYIPKYVPLSISLQRVWVTLEIFRRLWKVDISDRSWSEQEGNGPLNERATMAMIFEVIFGLRFEISNLNYPGIHVHVVSNSHFGGLWGHSSLQMASKASEVRFDLRFEISNLNYPGIHVHVAPNSHFGGRGGHGGLNSLWI